MRFCEDPKFAVGSPTSAAADSTHSLYRLMQFVSEILLKSGRTFEMGAKQRRSITNSAYSVRETLERWPNHLRFGRKISIVWRAIL